MHITMWAATARSGPHPMPASSGSGPALHTATRVNRVSPVHDPVPHRQPPLQQEPLQRVLGPPAFRPRNVRKRHVSTPTGSPKHTGQPGRSQPIHPLPAPNAQIKRRQRQEITRAQPRDFILCQKPPTALTPPLLCATEPSNHPSPPFAPPPIPPSEGTAQ